jgi:hypothetical protein
MACSGTALLFFKAGRKRPLKIDVCVYGRTVEVLKRILMKYSVRVWTGLVWLKTGDGKELSVRFSRMTLLHGVYDHSYKKK